MDWIRRHKWLLFALIFIGAFIAFFARWHTLREHSQDRVILAAAARYGVEPALVKAVVWRESRFNPGITGRAHEIGLMQIRQVAAQEWATAEKISGFNHRQLYDPARNTLAGTWYLHKLIGRYANTDNPLPYALADYNAGRTHVLHWLKGAASTNGAIFIEQINFPSMKDYVETVLRRYEHYRPIFPERN